MFQRLILAINEVFWSILRGNRILLTHCNRIKHKIWHHVLKILTKLRKRCQRLAKTVLTMWGVPILNLAHEFQMFGVWDASWVRWSTTSRCSRANTTLTRSPRSRRCPHCIFDQNHQHYSLIFMVFIIDNWNSSPFRIGIHHQPQSSAVCCRVSGLEKFFFTIKWFWFCIWHILRP